MTTQGEELVFPVTSPGAAQTAGEFDSLSKSMTKSAASWDAMTKGTSKAALGLGAMSNALGPLGDEFGALGQSVSRSAGIINNMTALLGGPWGLAIGVASAAVGFMAKQFSDASEAAETFAASAGKVQTSMDLIGQKNSANRARANQAQRDKLMFEDAASGIWKNSNAGNLSKIDQEIEIAEANGMIGRNIGGGGGGSGGPKTDPAFGQGRRNQLEAVDAAMAESKARDQLLLDNHKAFEVGKTEITKIENEFRMEEERARRAEFADMRASEFAAEQEVFEQRRKMHQDLTNMQKSAASDLGNIGIRAANEAAKGHAMGKKAAVQSIGDALVARGTAAIAEGGIWSSVPFMWGSGAPMIGMGLTAIAVGTGMGAASRAIPSGGSGGSGSTGTPQLAPASPVAVDRTGGDTRPTVINVNLSSTVAPTAEDGERVVRAVEEAKRQGRIG